MIIRAVIFDLDGTLVDSAPLIGAILNGMRAERGLAALPQESFRNLVSLGATELVGNAMGVESASADELVTEFRRRYAAAPTPPESLFDGVQDTLDALADRRIALAICSNKPEALCRKVLADTNLLRYFGVVVGGDTTEHSKPHKKPILEALVGVGAVADEGVLVGDSTVDQRGAAATGLRFVFFSGGYDDGVVRGDCFGIVEKSSQIEQLLFASARSLRVGHPQA